MNTGLRAATGDFIYFAAADDYALPELFATAVAALKANPRAAFFCGVSVLVNPQGAIVGFRPFMVPADRAAYLSPNDVRRILCSSDNWAVGSTVIFRRLRLLEAGGFDETMGALCDGILVRRLALEDGFCFDPIIGAAWEVYPESLSARSALSVTESLRLIDKATHEVRFNFPRDVSDSYAEKLNRRLRFNMARLWLVFEKGQVNVDHLGAVLKLSSFDKIVLGVLARLPAGRNGAMLSWMALRMRPYGLAALLRAWWRAIKLNWAEPPALEGVLRDAQSQVSPIR